GAVCQLSPENGRPTARLRRSRLDEHRWIGGISIFGILLALGSALSWALGTVYIKRQAAKVDSL
ncbi:hypothetical protein ABER23_33800, partial [Paenibacillus lautus]